MTGYRALLPALVLVTACDREFPSSVAYDTPVRQPLAYALNLGAVDDYNVVGSASLLPGAIRLTSSFNQRGAAWYAPKQQLSDGFDFEFTFRISPSNCGFGVGDGFAFVIQDFSPAALSSSGQGSDLGYAGIPRGLAVEFDIWDSGGSWSDPNGNHVGILTRGTLPLSANHAFGLALATPPFDLKDGNEHAVRVLYVPGTLQLFLEGAPVALITAAVHLDNIGGASILDATGSAWVGFTGATGGACANHDIIIVPNRAPVASPGGPYIGLEGSAVSMNLSGSDTDGDALTFAWDFGDGTTGSGNTPPATHTYADNGEYTVWLTVDDGKGGTDTRGTTATISNANPSVTLPAPMNFLFTIAQGIGVPVTIGFTDSGILDTHTATINCGAGVQDLGLVTSPVAHTCQYTSPGLKTISVTVTDKDGGSDTKSTAVHLLYDFTGFFRPVENRDAGGNYILNQVKAGAGVPVKFSLAGDFGLAILENGFPKSSAIPCDPSATVDGVDETMTAGSSSLSYDYGASQYVYVWKTEKSWGGTCRQLTVKLLDGTERKATFKFTK